jgi:acyl dehydratase
MDGLYFETIEVGDVEEGEEVAVDRLEMIAYAQANDPWPIHVDEAAGASSPFGDVIASFGYVVSLFFRAMHRLEMVQRAQGSFLGALEWRVQFRGVVRGEDRLRVRQTIVDKRLTSKGDRGVVTTQNELLNQDGVPVVVIDSVGLVEATA